MGTVRYVAAAAKERDELPPREREAIFNAVRKLQALGPDLPFPHAGDARGAPGLRELRPRGGHSPWRPLYRRAGDIFIIGAIGPDGKEDPRGFAAACRRARERLKEQELEEEDDHDDGEAGGRGRTP